jgi:SAM-dependent methyltransferase
MYFSPARAMHGSSAMKLRWRRAIGPVIRFARDWRASMAVRSKCWKSAAATARAWRICSNRAMTCGIDPSARAVARAAERGVRAERSTADRLPYGDGSFDVVMFGFCLYLCDDDDLFAIAREAHRVLAARGWLFIMDFEKPTPTYSDYRHRAGVRTRKMDYKTMFLWHPAYTLASHEKLHHETLQWTDDPDQWVSVACLRKCPPPSPSE